MDCGQIHPCFSIYRNIFGKDQIPQHWKRRCASKQRSLASQALAEFYNSQLYEDMFFNELLQQWKWRSLEKLLHSEPLGRWHHAKHCSAIDCRLFMMTHRYRAQKTTAQHTPSPPGVNGNYLRVFFSVIQLVSPLLQLVALKQCICRSMQIPIGMRYITWAVFSLGNISFLNLKWFSDLQSLS